MVKTAIGNALRRFAPRTMRSLAYLSESTDEYGGLIERFVEYDRELDRLRREVDELRRDHRRFVELYDATMDFVRDREPREPSA